MSEKEQKTIFGLNPMKVLFAMEYVLQGFANPFQGITYQPFFKHFRFNYGMTEADTQMFFSKSFLAWSFKPLIGFLMDAIGKTKLIMIFLLLSGAAMYILTPFFDVSAIVFYWMMFALSVLFACTDVAVDRATVLTGDQESQLSGRSKAATVGLNQSICWAAIYGTSIVAAASGGWIADNVGIQYLLIGLAAVPLVVFLVVLRLPRDTAQSIPLKDSVVNFWKGINTGPIVWIILFYFLFHFQPAMGALWTNYLIEGLHFTQTQIGYAEAVSYLGFFMGVLLFAWVGIKLQDRYGLKSVFKIFILLSIALNLTQYLLVDPYFSRIADWIGSFMPGMAIGTVRLGYYATYSFMVSIVSSFIRMSTFSLVGAVIPVNAAGSLFAGFMSVANLAYSFSYASGSWLYVNGLNYGICREIQNFLFSIPGVSGDRMSISLLIFIGSMAYWISFLSVNMLPDVRETRATSDRAESLTGPEQFNVLGAGFLRKVNFAFWAGAVLLFVGLFWSWHLDLIASLIITFFGATFLRKVFLDWRYKHRPAV
jgi:MFS family permease